MANASGSIQQLALNVSVYLVDGKVLLDSDSVATSEDCCCGGVCVCPCYDFSISGTVTTDVTCEEGGATRLWGQGATLPFLGTIDYASSGHYSGGFNTDCTGTGDACSFDPNECSDNYGPDCIPDHCDPGGGDPQFNCCLPLVVEADLVCQTEPGLHGDAGWYLRLFAGSTDSCNSCNPQFVTNASGDGFIKIAECADGPEGTYTIDLENEGDGTGTMQIVITIARRGGACCDTFGTCSFTSELCCDNLGFYFQGYDTTCEDDGCPLGACCFMGGCFQSLEQVCVDFGGTWMEGVPCSPNPC